MENDEEMNIEEPEINNEAVITPITVITPVITPIIAPISNDVIAPIAKATKAPIPKDCLRTDCHHMIERGMHFNRTDLLKGYGGICPECHVRPKGESKNSKISRKLCYL